MVETVAVATSSYALLLEPTGPVQPPGPPPVALQPEPPEPCPAPFDPRPAARVLWGYLERDHLRVSRKGTSPPTWTCARCEQVTEAEPKNALAFPHKPGCAYYQALRAYSDLMDWIQADDERRKTKSQNG